MPRSTDPNTKLPTRITIRLDAVAARRLQELTATTGANPSACVRQLLNESYGAVRTIAPDISLNCRAMIERLGDLRGELIACRRLIESGNASSSASVDRWIAALGNANERAPGSCGAG
jgi:hypothetical protein